MLICVDTQDKNGKQSYEKDIILLGVFFAKNMSNLRMQNRWVK